MLHQCLEVFANNRINLTNDFKASYDIALEHAKQVGVLYQFISMDKNTMDAIMLYRPVMVATEIPLILSYNGDVRQVRYESVTENDVLVGTADMIIEGADGVFTIVDWKTGMDDVDPPEENDQLLGLAWMAQRFFGFDKFRLAVINPVTKQANFSEVMTKSGMDLAGFIKVDKTRESAGDHCRYCPLKSNCVSFANMALKEVQHANFSGEGFFDDPEYGRE